MKASSAFREAANLIRDKVIGTGEMTIGTAAEYLDLRAIQEVVYGDGCEGCHASTSCMRIRPNGRILCSVCMESR